MTIVGTMLALPIATWMGVRAGTRPGTREDAAHFFGVLTYSMPAFWVGLILISLFAIAVPIFPTGQKMTPGKEVAKLPAHAFDVAKHLVLPVVTFAMALPGQHHIVMRNSMIGATRRSPSRCAAAARPSCSTCNHRFR